MMRAVILLGLATGCSASASPTKSPATTASASATCTAAQVTSCLADASKTCYCGGCYDTAGALTALANNANRLLDASLVTQYATCQATCNTANTASANAATLTNCLYDCGRAYNCGGGDDDKSACVALDSPVVVKGRGEVQLRELQFGDEVQDTASTTSPFVAWLDRSEDAADFLELRHETGTLSITPGHLLKMDGAFDAARYARVGRMLQTPAGPSAILSVTASHRAGFAAPLTRSGTIVVAGSEISCYHEAPGAWGSANAVHQLANAGFLPLRWGLPVDGATYASALGWINSAIMSVPADLPLYARTLFGGSSFM